MAAEAFVALVNANSRGRSVIKIAEDAGLPPHRIQRYMKPSFELTRMPTPDRVQEIAAAVGVEAEAVRRAFVTDLINASPDAPEVVGRRERELLTLFQRLSMPYQETLIQMAKSLSHLERSVAHDGTPDLGDGRSAM